MTASRLEKAYWLWHRLRNMSVPEVLHRVKEHRRRVTGVRLTPKMPAAFHLRSKAPEIPGLRQAVTGWSAPQGVRAHLLDVLKRARDHHYSFLGTTWPAGDSFPSWGYDPVTDQSWPQHLYCFHIPYRKNKHFGDIKYAWERQRLQYLQPLAVLGTHPGREEAAALALHHLEHWLDYNPPYKGIAWCSGIELALRAFSMLWVSSLLGNHMPSSLSDKLWDSLYAHGVWLKRFPSKYSSANNHLIAEAFGLFMLGHLFEQPSWHRYGKQVLEEQVAKQFHPDGIGAEQSPTYSAFTLELYAVSCWIGRQMDDPFSPETLAVKNET